LIEVAKGTGQPALNASKITGIVLGGGVVVRSSVTGIVLGGGCCDRIVRGGVRVELSKKEAKIAKMWPKYKSRIMETQKAVSNYGTYR
jgi:hypothetical protein